MGYRNRPEDDNVELLLGTRRLPRPDGYATYDPVSGKLREFEVIQNRSLIRRILAGFKKEVIREKTPAV